MHTDRRIGIFHIAIVVVLIALAHAAVRATSGRDGLLHVYFFDVGQGDAILIESPNGTQVLIDGGPGDGVLDRLSEVMSPLDRTIDAVVVSHPHADHIGGLSAVAARYEIGTVVQSLNQYESGQFRMWQNAIAEEGARVVEGIAGTYLDLGGGVRLTVVSPFDSGKGATTDEPHQYNVTVLLTFGEMRMLLTGDMEEEGERALLASTVPTDVDVLKIGHHGSRTSSSPAFLQATTPDVAVISIGARNRYGHPAPSVLARLENLGIPYYRTDTAGTITLVANGEEFSITPQH